MLVTRFVASSNLGRVHPPDVGRGGFDAVVQYHVGRVRAEETEAH